MRFLLLILLLLCVWGLITQIDGDQIFSAHSGNSFGRSSRDPKYRIQFHSEDSPYHPVEGSRLLKFGLARFNENRVPFDILTLQDDGQESITMAKKDGENYVCFLPKVEKAKTGKLINPVNTSTMIVETEKRIKLKTPDELLEVFKDQCFIRQEGWWSYEFCYEKKLRQIHVEDEKVVQEFILGVYDEEATAAFNQNLSDVSTLKDPRSKDASQRYHAHQYTNGTICDLTNKPRETEVRFVCSESRAMINSITEVSTCKYALTIQCPTLCKHPLFQEEKPVWHTINCNALPKSNLETTKVEKESDWNKIVMVSPEEYPSKSESSE